MSELERLRALLLAPERGELAQHQAAIDELRQAQGELPARLPQLLDQVEQGEHRESLHRVLAPVVAASLTDAVRRDRRSIVDALFPIIGPTIRKAIAEALRGFVADLNRALDYSLTPRGLRWRLESWRTGVPFAQVVMKHTLRYSVDHLFLIERESGLLLYRHSAPLLPDLDADAIAGMLTAIGDFVRDSVQSPSDSDGGLASATVGEHLLQVYEGPKAVLACFIRGVPPSRLSEQLREALEELHRASDAGDPGFDWDIAAAPLLSAGDLAEASTAEAEQLRPARWPMMLILLLSLSLLGAWTWQGWQRQELEQSVRETIAATPGWLLLDLQFDRRWRLQLLRDPNAQPLSSLAARTGIAPEQFEFHEQRFLALDDSLVAARARQLLQPGPDIALTVEQGQLQVRGSAVRSWARRLQEQGHWLPGVSSIDASELSIVADAADLARLALLKSDAEARPIPFRRGRSEMDATATAAAQALSRVLREILELTQSNEIGAIIRVRGWSDDGGSDTLNAELRAARAQALQEVLVSNGIPLDRLQLETDDAGLGTPSASVSLQLDPQP